MKSIYFKSLEINDIGPLSRVDYKFPFRSQLPRPVVFVGSNGSGKSILLSHLLNPLLTAQQVAFDDAEVEPNRVYKLRSPSYIKSGSNYATPKFVLVMTLSAKSGNFRSRVLSMRDVLGVHLSRPFKKFQNLEPHFTNQVIIRRQKPLLMSSGKTAFFSFRQIDSNNRHG